MFKAANSILIRNFQKISATFWVVLFFFPPSRPLFLLSLTSPSLHTRSLPFVSLFSSCPYFLSFLTLSRYSLSLLFIFCIFFFFLLPIFHNFLASSFLVQVLRLSFSSASFLLLSSYSCFFSVLLFYLFSLIALILISFSLL